MPFFCARDVSMASMAVAHATAGMAARGGHAIRQGKTDVLEIFQLHEQAASSEGA